MKNKYLENEKLKTAMFIAFCIETGKSPRLALLQETHDQFDNWIKKETQEHDGDCTASAQTCSRCLLQGYEIWAETICGLLDIKDGGD